MGQARKSSWLYHHVLMIHSDELKMQASDLGLGFDVPDACLASDLLY